MNCANNSDNAAALQRTRSFTGSNGVTPDASALYRKPMKSTASIRVGDIDFVDNNTHGSRLRPQPLSRKTGMSYKIQLITLPPTSLVAQYRCLPPTCRVGYRPD